MSNGFVFDAGEVDWYPDYVPYPAGDWIGHYHITDPTEAGWLANNGTKYFTFDYLFDNSILNIYGDSGQVIGVRQFDLAEALQGTCTPVTPPTTSGCTVTFMGLLADGGTTSQTVTLDGIFDGIGLLDDFERFTSDGRWNRLTMFSIDAKSAYLNPGLDNLVIRTVPEPGTLALFGIGLAGIGLARRR